MYFKRTGRPPGRPLKLTGIERENMPAEHDELCHFIRDHCAVDADGPAPRDVLNQLFRRLIFQKDLFTRFPLKRAIALPVWNRFLRKTSPFALKKRALYYLALRYDVSHHTIHRAIWPDHLSPEAAQDSSPQPVQ